MPTTKPRYTFTDTGQLADILDAAQRRWPEIGDRKTLLLRLAEQGHESLELDHEQHEEEARRNRARAALGRIPSLIEAELLLSDQAWS